MSEKMDAFRRDRELIGEDKPASPAPSEATELADKLDAAYDGLDGVAAAAALELRRLAAEVADLEEQLKEAELRNDRQNKVICEEYPELRNVRYAHTAMVERLRELAATFDADKYDCGICDSCSCKPKHCAAQLLSILAEPRRKESSRD